MNLFDTSARPTGGRFRIPRSRGAISGLLLVVLGSWGALIPFVGPYFDFGYTGDGAWLWTTSRGWLEVLPGVVTIVGGLLLMLSRNRATAMFGSWLAIVAGAWFVVGRAFATVLTVGEIGAPSAAAPARALVLELTYFYGLGVLIVFLGAAALGRLSVRTLRDVSHARRGNELAAANMAPAEAPTEVIEREPRHRNRFGLFGRRHTLSH